jgi:hypothetical protein
MRTRRSGVAACPAAAPPHPSLAASLAQYVRADDVSLSRDLFLRLVLNRIVDDLSARLRFQLRDNNKEQL